MVFYHELDEDEEELEEGDGLVEDVAPVAVGSVTLSASVTLSMEAKIEDTILRLSTPDNNCLRKK